MQKWPSCEGWDLIGNPPLSTPRASDMKAGGHGDTGRMGSARHQLQQAMLATPRKTDADRGFRGDVLSQLNGYPSRHAGMLGTPTANPAPRGSVLRRQKGRMTTDQDDFDRTPNMGEVVHFLMPETLPTPTKRDKRMDAWSPAYDKRKSPTMDAVLDGAQTGRAPDKWAYARQIAAILTEAGLIGPSETLPVTYGWMLGYRPGRFWLSCLKKGVCDGKASD
ncbi:hypothetical protein NZL82_15340 [Sphingomonas sanguinis]|uniref:hypothetical protein n=1 Tax=unclassified Sphingomonas TaxID=196159 RepID=UPI0021BB3335|nr:MULTISPECIES: hypothetical protein [unclassified Sphingomonas]MBQ1481305.1 hypothetical protein [Sphingomonas sp.]MCT8003249.1 hypothetical protein [Sphingomonas sp. LC-1]